MYNLLTREKNTHISIGIGGIHEGKRWSIF